MKSDENFKKWVEQVNKPFIGWDFSFITETGRVKSEPIHWSYGSTALQLMKESSSMLDMGTGGGEFLSKLYPFPPHICATEGYKPNFPIAKKRLEPLGVSVFSIDEDNKLPFECEEFDLVLNQHEAYDPKEVSRILKTDGLFLTQQVGGKDCVEINHDLDASVPNDFLHWSLDYAVNELMNEGFIILKAEEAFPFQRFYDIGALIYYLKAIPWQITDFSFETYEENLYKIHRAIEEKGHYDVKQHRFMILAGKR
ncbi:SAM-dependent methyltransferase [Bacillus pakistanensis]|uniref:SAM-dependent methyltransferase n=1 Tax=Rossellomorea pakistanensis TaxID=992288 RepID=A0ABS2N7M3_9BACI|nr:methyltransferase domain-containing protein [Bacillus pakistanensis]MBM7583857.1 SAM-dependent methyltransferase [Bacillus pakistanensis]